MNANQDLRVRVLFVCTGNTCRSMMAEHIANRKFGGRVLAASAGTDPGIAPHAQPAIETLRDIGIKVHHHEPKDVRKFQLHEFDLVIAVDTETARVIRQLYPDVGDRLRKWAINDPFGGDPSEYRRCAERLYAAMLRDEQFSGPTR